jgi:hypothetical protein
MLGYLNITGLEVALLNFKHAKLTWKRVVSGAKEPELPLTTQNATTDYTDYTDKCPGTNPNPCDP